MEHHAPLGNMFCYQKQIVTHCNTTYTRGKWPFKSWDTTIKCARTLHYCLAMNTHLYSDWKQYNYTNIVSLTPTANISILRCYNYVSVLDVFTICLVIIMLMSKQTSRKNFCSWIRERLKNCAWNTFKKFRNKVVYMYLPV